MAERAVHQSNIPPQLCIDHFNFEELHNVMKMNASQVLGLLDEISSLYAQLNLFKNSGSVMDRKRFITLNGAVHGQGTTETTPLQCQKQPSKLRWIHPTSIYGKDVAVR